MEQSTVAANQQIVIQFSDETISTEATVSTIEAIYAKLQSVGAQQIKVGKSENGQLKITYFSDADVNKIEDALSNSAGFELAYDSKEKTSSGFPSEKTAKDYKLNISEIQSSFNTGWDFEGVEIVELKQKSEHSYNLKVKTSGHKINAKYSNSIILVAIKINTSIAIAIDKLSYNIPEVRAGPTV